MIIPVPNINSITIIIVILLGWCSCPLSLPNILNNFPSAVKTWMQSLQHIYVQLSSSVSYIPSQLVIILPQNIIPQHAAGYYLNSAG